jgi:D-alanine transfer protein
VTPRLASAALALLLFAAALAAADHYAAVTAGRDVHAIAPQLFPEKIRGALLQRAAFAAPDLLPLYGSSELTVPDPAHASAVFRDYPSGFTVFPVGAPGTASLSWLQAIAAVGGALEGRPVAISIAPRAFTRDMVDPQAYAASYSPLQANALAFSLRLSFPLKQEAARRMLAYPDTLAGDPLLAFALARLADGSWPSRLLYYASLPLGRLQLAILHLRDAWQTLAFLRAQDGLHDPPRRARPLDWDALHARAEAAVRPNADVPFGFAPAFWSEHGAEVRMQGGSYPAEALQRDLASSAEWTDLDLLLRAVRELGGRPLLLSAPMKGAYYDHLGATAASRTQYYNRLRALAARRAVPLRAFADRETDPLFTIDPQLHLSSTGWIAYNRALEDFFHQRGGSDM